MTEDQLLSIISEDEKLQLFLSNDIQKAVLNSGICKHLDTKMLTALSKPEYRMALVEAMLEGRYKIEAPYIATIPKDNGKVRTILVNDNLDRYVLSAITKVYFEMYSQNISKACVSYQKGIGVATVMKDLSMRNLSNMNGVKIDFSKFFESVSRENINRTLKEHDTGSILDKLLFDFYNTDEVYDKKDGEIIKYYKSLCQGCAFSTFLADIYLNRLDEQLREMAEVYVRYSDDILLLGKGWEKAYRLLLMELPKYGVTINPDKVCLIEKQKPFTFLGVEINGNTYSLTKEKVKEFKTAVKLSTVKHRKSKNRSEQQKAVSNVMNKLYGVSNLRYSMVAYYFSVINNLQQVRQLDDWVKYHIRTIYAGTKNYTTAKHKTSDEQLQEMGYISLTKMFMLYKYSYTVYLAELKNIRYHNEKGLKYEQNKTTTLIPAKQLLQDIANMHDTVTFSLNDKIVFLNKMQIKLAETKEVVKEFKTNKAILDKLRELWRDISKSKYSTLFITEDYLDLDIDDIFVSDRYFENMAKFGIYFISFAQEHKLDFLFSDEKWFYVDSEEPTFIIFRDWI